MYGTKFQQEIHYFYVYRRFRDSEVFTTVSMKISILGNVTPSVLVPIVHNTRRHWPQS